MKLIKPFSLLSLLLVIMSCQVPSQIEDSEHYKLHVNLENAPFDSLFLRDYTTGRDLLFEGKKTKEFTWVISIPDSIVSDFEQMELVVTPYDSIRNSTRLVRFITERDGKQIIIANVGVEDRDSYIRGVYREETIFPNQYLIDNAGLEVVGDLFSEDFNLIIQDDQADIAVRAQDPYFSWFVDLYGEGRTYDDFLASYIEIAKKYPDSRFLLTYLAVNLTSYKSKEDVRTIYNTLSSKHKNTIWGTVVERFFSWKTGGFENSTLPNLTSNTEEDIVQDSSKYNLVIFSASWCPPCIAEIPLLKEIHEDLHKGLIFTYVSTDEEKTVASFQKLMKENDIPWRTLYAYQDVRKIEQKYAFQSIPYSILIHPNGNTEIIDVRKDEDRAMLYSLF